MERSSKCFWKIICKNIYAGIDAEFSYKDGGLKYSFIIHPGADASLD